MQDWVCICFLLTLYGNTHTRRQQSQQHLEGIVMKEIPVMTKQEENLEI